MAWDGAAVAGNILGLSCALSLRGETLTPKNNAAVWSAGIIWACGGMVRVGTPLALRPLSY